MSQKDCTDSALSAQTDKAVSDSARALFAAVERACVEWETDLRCFLRGVLRRDELVDEAFQRTVLRALQKSSGCRQESLRGWLFQVALNEARGLRRERLRQDVHLQALSESAGGGTKNIEWINAEDGVVSQEWSALIIRSLKKLPEGYQEVIRRRIYEGRTFAEIAESLNLPLGTVLTYMRRGLQRLREDSRLQDYQSD